MFLYRMGFIYLFNTGRRLEQKKPSRQAADKVESQLFLVAYVVVYLVYLKYSFEDN